MHQLLVKIEKSSQETTVFRKACGHVLLKTKTPSSKSISKITKDRFGESVLKLVLKFERTDLRCRKLELYLSFL